MQRVRIGLTGLAFVFVVVLLAAVFTSPSEEEPITANTLEQQLAPGAFGACAKVTSGNCIAIARGQAIRSVMASTSSCFATFLVWFTSVTSQGRSQPRIHTSR